MTNKYKVQRQDINRRIYRSKTVKRLKQIAKLPKHGLLNVDHYTKANKDELVERLVIGRQLEDENKNTILKYGQDQGLKLNASKSKKKLIEIIRNPKLEDLNNKRLRGLADKMGVPLRSQMTDGQIRERLNNPSKYFTVESLKRLLRNNNIEVPRNISKPDLINLAAERNLITTTPITAQEANLGVTVENIPETLRKTFKKKARTAREAVANFKEYIKNLKKDYITPARLNRLSRQLERKIKKAEEEKERIFTPKKEASAFRKYTTQYVIINTDPSYDPLTFLNDASPAITNIFNLNRNIKAFLCLFCKMKRTDSQGFTAIKRFMFHSKGQKLILESTDIYEIYEEMINEIEEEIQKAENAQGSGWVFVEVENLTLHTVIWDPLKASSYIKLPEELKNKKAITNMKNEDDKCFMWCVLRALNPKDKNAERVDKDLKSKEHTLNMDGIAYPVDFRGIDRFESQNPEISITVLGYNKDERIYPLKISKYTGSKHDITLLLIKDGDKSHYCLVKNISALLSSQINKHKGTCNICLNCFNGFNTQDSLNKHKEYCYNNECVKINMPPSGSFLEFKNFVHSEKAPFAIYADFESLIKPLNVCDPDPEKSYTKKYQKHEPISFCYYIKSFDESVYKSKLRVYTKKEESDYDAMDTFINWLESDVKEIANLENKDMIFTPENEKEFINALNCWICGEYMGNDRVRDHCHFTGKFRGAACNSCNLKLRRQNNISVFFHNLSGYDSHLFIKKLGTPEEKENIDCIPSNEEKYISFSKTIITGQYKNKEGETKDKTFKIIFKDSLKFMSSSLGALVNNLPRDAFNNLLKYFTPGQAEILKQKGFYPYEYMDNVKRFKENKPPPRKAFYSKLTGRGITITDYKHVWNVWNTFNMKTLKEYHELYNLTDVLLLADVFENFRDLCLKIYKLDPVYYYTTPGLAWDACLKITNIQLELLSDVNMLLMFEKGIRGGISIISNRYGEANNKYMKKFNKKKLNKFLMYLDANNLYGWAESQKLPTHGFKWLTSGEMEKLFNNQIVQVWEKIPCILEVDLEYPTKLHNLHNDYPLCPERVECKNKVEKLIPNLRDKKNYVIHYKNLMQCLKLGMKLKKIHRGIRFTESEWMKSYIDTNAKLRAQAKNNFEKDFFKLMNNSVFGKTIENIRNRVDVKLVNTEEKFKKLVAKPNFKSWKIFNENLISVHMKKTSLTMNKPVYLGMCILDLSKTLMYDFHYNYIKPKYGNKAKLLFTDTDSFLYEIETEDFYKDISGDVKDRFDTSEYNEGHPSGIPTGINKKVLGMFKDEAKGKIIKEFVGLRAKLYSYIMEEGKENKKCKGVKKQVVEENITHEDYKTCLLTGKEILRKQNILRSYDHEVYTEEVNKIALSAADDKRYLLTDSFDTLAWGHRRIKKMEN